MSTKRFMFKGAFVFSALTFPVSVFAAPPIAASSQHRWSADQYASAEDLLKSHTWAYPGARFRQCAPLPTDKQILNGLKYSKDEVPIKMPGLTRGLTALPAGLARSSFCISPKPSSKDIQGIAEWYKRLFTIARESAPMPSSKDNDHLEVYSHLSPVRRRTFRKTLRRSEMSVRFGGNINIQRSSAAKLLRVATSYSRLTIPNFNLVPVHSTANGQCSEVAIEYLGLWSGIGG